MRRCRAATAGSRRAPSARRSSTSPRRSAAGPAPDEPGEVGGERANGPAASPAAPPTSAPSSRAASSAMAWANGPYGSSTSSWHAPSSTRPPSAWTSVANSDTSRLLPIPASAVTTTIIVCPAGASRHCWRRTSRSAVRPTNVGVVGEQAERRRNEADAAPTSSTVRPRRGRWRGVASQLAPVVDAELAQERRHVRLHGALPRCRAGRRSRRSSGARRSAPAPPLPDASRPGRASHPPARPSRCQHVTGQGGGIRAWHGCGRDRWSARCAA